MDKTEEVGTHENNSSVLHACMEIFLIEVSKSAKRIIKDTPVRPSGHVFIPIHIFTCILSV